MRLTPILALPVLLAPAPLAAEVSVVYVANEGFLLAAGDQRVLIDALLDDGIPGYAVPPGWMRPALEQGDPPFDGVDLVLATHHHGDHLGPRAVARHLESNPDALFVSTPQGAERVRTRLPGDLPLAERIVGKLPAAGARELVEWAGITVELLNLHHGLGSETQNLGFLITLGGLRILHVGDTEVEPDEIAPFHLPRERIDLALLPDWLLVTERLRPVALQAISPRWMGVMHLALPDAPASWFGPEGSREGRLRVLRAVAPAARIFTSPGESALYPPPR